MTDAQETKIAAQLSRLADAAERIAAALEKAGNAGAGAPAQGGSPKDIQSSFDAVEEQLKVNDEHGGPQAAVKV